jgi:hypothetical protein
MQELSWKKKFDRDSQGTWRQIINSERYINDILRPLLIALKKKRYGYFIQINDMVCIDSYPVTVLH